MSDSRQRQENQDGAPWILKAISIKIKGDEEPIALVGTPEGDKTAPLSEAKGKVDLFGQLPKYQQEKIVRDLYRKYLEWLKTRNETAN